MPKLEFTPSTTYRMYIKKAVIPYNWNRITESTRTLTINGTPYLLPIGSPNILDLVDILNNLQSVFTVSFDRVTSKLEWYNQTASPATISTTAYELMGAEPNTTYTFQPLVKSTLPKLVDVRPTPIIEIKVDLKTAGDEVQGGALVSTNILCAIAMNVPIYSHKVWVDDAGLYFADVTNEYRDITFELQTPDGDPIIPQSPPYFVIGFDKFENYDRELLSTQKQSLKLQKYNMLLTHEDQIAEENIV